MNAQSARPLALVTGASSGIGLELALLCAAHGHDLLIAADRPLGEATRGIEGLGARVEALEVDLAEVAGVHLLCGALRGRTPDVLIANAGHGLGRGFLDQDFDDVRHVVDTNITGTLLLIQHVGRLMRSADRGRILITGSIAGVMPGTFQAVYNGTKAFIDSFSLALRNELKGKAVTVSCLMPGPTDTDFFERADMETTKVANDPKMMMQPDEVARIGFDAMRKGEADVVAGWRNRMQVAMSKVMPAEAVAQMHRKVAEPGSADKK